MNTSDYITIPLTQGQETIIDACDADLAEFKWHAQKSNSGYYASRNITIVNGDQKAIPLHRAILEKMLDRSLENGEWVDHKDRNTLNNRRENLRLADPSKNARNRKRPSTNTTGYKGVQKYGDNRWRVQIYIDGRNKHIGLFDDLQDAINAYQDAALHYYGEFACFG